MNYFVVDNSVVMSWCFEDEKNQYADNILDYLSDAAALVPPVWALEVMNVLLVAERKKRLTEADSARFITLLSQLPITVEYDAQKNFMKDLLVLARSNNLSSYDASYFDLSMRKGIPIATLDKQLLAAAKKVSVPILFSE